MNLPLVGYISQQAMLLGGILLLCSAYGLVAGFNRSSKMLLACVLALGISVIPQVNDFIAGLIKMIFGRSAGHAAYLLVYVSLLLVFRSLLSRVSKLVSIKQPMPNKILGLISGAVQGFAHVSMVMVLLYGFRMPASGLYARSDIASFVSQIWAKIGLLPELYSLQFLNPGTLL